MRQKGTVKWFDNARSYGFILSDEGNEIFVHFTGIQSRGFRSLEEGQRVEFSIIQRPEGPEARGVFVIE